MQFHKRFGVYIFLFLLCLVLMLCMSRILVDTRIHEIALMLDLVAKNASERLDGSKALVELAAASDNVAHVTPPQAEIYLKALVENDSDMWSHFLITDTKGVETAHTEGAKHYGKSIAEREYFITPFQKKTTVIAQPIHSVSTGRKIIAIGTPIQRGNAESAVLVGFIHLQYVSALLNENAFTPSSYQLMANLDGTISAHPDDSAVLSRNIDTMFSNEICFNITALRRGWQIANVENCPSLVVWSPLQQQRLSVVSVMPLTEAFSNVILLNIVLAVIFLSLSMAYLILSKLRVSHTYAHNMAVRASTDILTGLKNRQWLENFDVDAFCEKTFTVVFFDVDDFKFFNDKHNHGYGDEVLRFVGASMRACTRPESDVSVRYAGDEFLIVLRDTEIEKAQLVTERVRKALRDYRCTDGTPDPITISSGIAVGEKGVQGLFEVIAVADDAIYRAKSNGKDQIIISGDVRAASHMDAPLQL